MITLLMGAMFLYLWGRYGLRNTLFKLAITLIAVIFCGLWIDWGAAFLRMLARVIGG